MLRHLIIVALLISLKGGAQHYLFYLHGRIVELQGAGAVDTVNGYGAYQYDDILKAFGSRGFTVISEVRGPGTEVKTYARKVARQIDSLLGRKVKPQQITVVGASKGAVIAMYVSTFLKNPGVNFVFMGGCHEGSGRLYDDILFCGNILSVYEKSDAAGPCEEFKKRGKDIAHYREMELHTGLKHGFLYKPLPEWIEPAVKWAKGDYD